MSTSNTSNKGNEGDTVKGSTPEKSTGNLAENLPGPATRKASAAELAYFHVADVTLLDHDPQVEAGQALIVVPKDYTAEAIDFVRRWIAERVPDGHDHKRDNEIALLLSFVGRQFLQAVKIDPHQPHDLIENRKRPDVQFILGKPLPDFKYSHLG